MNILFADDDLRIREYVACLLANWPDHQLTLAASGQEAWAMLDDPRRWFDLAILDLNMPSGTGFEVIKRIKESALHARMDIIICTARADRNTVDEAIGHGTLHYVVKPWIGDTLKQKIAQIAQAREARERLSPLQDPLLSLSRRPDR
ncbi:MAG: response regulator [Opitutae bacterium]|nr:response regulator [Opitutae bacterium]